MIKTKLMIINKLGLHARAAVKLVNTVSRFGSNILIAHKGRQIDAHDVMSVMVLGASAGSEIEVTVTGSDEREASDAIAALINDRFGEPE